MTHLAHPITHALSRPERRRLLEREAQRRKSGQWPEWRVREIPYGAAGRHWAAEFNKVWTNEVFSVLVRHLSSGHTHLMISNLSGLRPTWWEAQRIKNEIAGFEACAVEIYPPQSEVVDDANAYHLWVLPEPFPHSLSARRAA